MAYSTQTGTEGALGHFSPAASWLDTSERVAGHVQRLVEQLQQAQSQMFQRMSTDTKVASEEARETTRVQDLVSLQMAYVAGEYTRLAQFYSQILSGLFSVQNQWTKDLEAKAGALLGGLVNGKQTPASIPTSVPAWPAVFAPTELFQTAQATWTEMTKVMLGAIEHDLQAERPAAGDTEADTTEAEPATESTRPARSRRAASRG
jgi:hypothetical protein